MKRCIFCGEVLNDDLTCPNVAQHFKPMCVNCTYCTKKDGNNLECSNETNITNMINKIKEQNHALCNITTLELSIPLKDPTKKCGNYNINVDGIITELEKYN
jgi:hypothetical protein